MKQATLLTAAAGLMALAVSAAPAFGTSDSATHRCKSGYRHAIIGGKHACLRVGVRCLRRYDRQYHRYGFHCHSGRLTRRVVAPPAPPPPSTDLSLVAVDGPDPVTVGGELTYTLTATNLGPDMAARLVVGTQQLASQINGGTVQVVRFQGPCAVVSGIFSCVFGDLAVGASARATLVVRPTVAMTLSVLWTVEPSDTLGTTDPNTMNNSAQTTTIVSAPPPPPPSGNCHPSYPDVCIPPPPPDLDCGEISYRNFRVIFTVADPDPHRFDGDKDGVGCET